MTFLHAGLAAAGLACVAIPIAVHLLMRRRRRPVMWGAMRFLIEAYRMRRRRLLLEQWLLLATRCLLVVLIALAVGRPLVGALAGPATGGRTLYILIDNSMTSAAADADGATALQRHKQAARSLLTTLGGTDAGADRTALIAIGSPTDEIIVPPSPDLLSVASLADDLEPTDSRADIHAALTSVRAAIEAAHPDGVPPGRVSVALLSDFLAGSATPDAALPRLPENVRLLATRPAADGPPNTAVTAIDPLRALILTDDSPGATAQARVTLSRSGAGVGRADATTVRLRVLSEDTDQPESTATVRWTAGQETATVSLPLPAGAARPGVPAALEARIDADPLPADNTHRRPVEVRRTLTAAVIAPTRFGPRARVDELDPASWIRLALAPDRDAAIEVIDIEPGAVDAAALARADAVFLPTPHLIDEASWSRLRAFHDDGGIVIVTPPHDQSVHLWPDLLTDAFDLEFTPARETVEAPDAALGVGLRPEPGPGIAADGDAARLLALLRAELDELLSPVNILRALPVTGAPRADDVLIRADHAGPILIAARPADRRPETDDDQPPPTQTHHHADRGMLVYLAVAPDLQWTDLPARPLMLPLFQELARQGTGIARSPGVATAGTTTPLPPRTAALEPYPPDADDTRRRITASDSGSLDSLARRAGLWRAIDDRGAHRGLIAVNPDPHASNTNPNDPAAIERWLAAATHDDSPAWIETDEAALATLLGADTDRAPISLPLLIAALLCALIETGLARRASHAEVGPPTGAAP